MNSLALTPSRLGAATRRDHGLVTIQRTTVLAGSVERAFDLSLDIDAHLASMGTSAERAEAGVTAGIIGLSESVTWRARHFGVTWRMTNKIVEWDRPTWFVDQQVHGPFASYRHEHRFRDVGGRTEMDDRVTFRAPLGLLGSIVNRLVLTRYMSELLDTRNAFLVREMASDTS